MTRTVFLPSLTKTMKIKFEDLGIFGRRKTNKTYELGDYFLLGNWGMVYLERIEETENQIIYYFGD